VRNSFLTRQVNTDAARSGRVAPVTSVLGIYVPTYSHFLNLFCSSFGSHPIGGLPADENESANYRCSGRRYLRLVVSLMRLRLYLLGFLLPLIGMLPGSVGLVLTMFYGAPVYQLTIRFGFRKRGWDSLSLATRIGRHGVLPTVLLDLFWTRGCGNIAQDLTDLQSIPVETKLSNLLKQKVKR
jgi:hypothetical protein